MRESACRWRTPAAVGRTSRDDHRSARRSADGARVRTTSGDGLVVLAVAGSGLLLARWLGWRTAAIMRSEALGAVLVFGVLPRLDITAGGLATADFLVRTAGMPNAAGERARRTAVARSRIAGIAVGIAVAGVAVGLWLAVAGTAPDHLVATLLGLGLLIRSRLVAGTWPAAAVAVAGTVVLAVGTARVVVDPPSGSTWLTPLAVALVAGLVLAVSRPGRPGTARVMYSLESTALIAMVGVTAGAFGLWDAIAGLPA